MLTDFIHNFFTLLLMENPLAGDFFAERTYVQGWNGKEGMTPSKILLHHLDRCCTLKSIRPKVVETFELDGISSIKVARVSFDDCSSDCDITFFLKEEDDKFKIISMILT